MSKPPPEPEGSSGTWCRFGWCPAMPDGSPVCDVLPHCGCVDSVVFSVWLEMLETCDVQNVGYEEREARRAALGCEKLTWVTLLCLDAAGLIEHGGNIMSSWRTEKGEMFLKLAKTHWAQPEVD